MGETLHPRYPNVGPGIVPLPISLDEKPAITGVTEQEQIDALVAALVAVGIVIDER